MQSGRGLSCWFPARRGDRGRRGADNRLYVDACLWLVRGATPWRDLPPELGHWKSVYTRFRRGSWAGIWESLFNALYRDPYFEYVLIDVEPLERQWSE